MRRIEPILRRAFREARIPQRGARVLVAVSGGADSTALLLGLHRLAPELGIELTAAHLHHGLRGRDADGDAEFVTALCARLSIPLLSARWNTRERMRRLGWSGQDGLRRLRRLFLTTAARRAGAHRIATAHTADDQVETLLMRLRRGTGLSGLGGMSLQRGVWLRPLLEASRADIEADLRASGETWREDSSNADLSYERNRVRHRVVSAWADREEERSLLARNVAATLREVRAARRWLERRAEVAVAKAVIGSRPIHRFDRRLLSRLPDIVLRAALRRICASTLPSKRVTRRVLNEILTLVRGTPGRAVSLPGGWTAWSQEGTLGIGSEGIQQRNHDDQVPLALRVPGRNRLGSFDLEASWVGGREARQLAGRGGEAFAAAHLKGGLELRLGRTDELFIPFGRRRARRLGDFLKQSGIRRPYRADRMVLSDRQGILWVVGLRRSARAPLTSSTRKALWVKVRT